MLSANYANLKNMNSKTVAAKQPAVAIEKKVVKRVGQKVKGVKIMSEEVYTATLNEIDNLMKKGEKNLLDSELKRLRILSEAVEVYEDTQHPLPVPASLPEMIRMRMHQMRISQNYAANLLGVSDAKFSLIINGKQKPDIYFVKAIHDKMNIDANLILKAI